MFFCSELPENGVVTPDGASEQWTGYRETESINSVGRIAIPGIDIIVFNANETCQKVNIYNPEENACLIRFTLLIDGYIYWQSGFCSPGNGYYDIELIRPIEAGTYHATLMHECQRPDGTVLNSASMNITIVAR